MSQLTVYGIPGSPYFRAALVGLEEKALPYRVVALPLGGHKSPEHLARHPFGRVPALEHGDFRLYETQAILRYLDRISPEPAFVPKDSRAEARANQLAGIADWYVMPDISSPIVFQRLVAPQFGLPVDEARLQAAIPRAEVCMAELSRLLGDQPFMAGEALSIADIVLAPQLEYFTAVEEGWPMFEPHPNLLAWVGRMSARPSMAATTRDAVVEKAAA
jgi:glutathione S-transferase